MGHDSIQQLRNAIKKGRILAIVGAGVSFAATNDSCASWAGLLLNGIERAIDLHPHLKNSWEKSCQRDLASGNLVKLIAVAGRISKELGAPRGGEFRRWLRESVGGLGELEISNPSVLQALADLKVQLATTNYDGLIEKVTGLRPVTWQNKNLVDRLVRGDEPAVLHMHGYWEEPESIAFSKNSYGRLQRNSYAQHTIRALCSHKTFLYIGCGTGLTDPNFSAFLKWQQELFSESEHQHFRLCLNREAEDLRHQHVLPERILIISYGDDYADLAPFLQSLTPVSGSKIIERPAAHVHFPKPTRCYGRKKEVQDLVRAVCSDLPVSIPVLGPPGIGKTTITQEAGSDQRVCERFGMRKYFVLCESAMSREALLGEIAWALKLRPGLEVEALIFQELERAPTLLVLDNAETPRDNDEDRVDRLIVKLAEVPQLALVVSLRGKRRPFGPSWRKAIQVGPLSRSAARQSFLKVAGDDFRNDPQLDSLLEKTDRIPLVINLLAYQAEGGFDLSSLARRWQEEPKLLQRAGGGKRLTDFYFSIELSISSPRMSDKARRLLSLLGYLPDGIASEDLPCLLPEGSETAAVTLRRVGLVDPDGPRTRAYAPIREHVRLQHPPTQEDLDRAIDHFVRLVHCGEVGKRENKSEHLNRFASEAGNLQAMVFEALKRSDAIPGIEAALALAELSFAADSCRGVLPEALQRAKAIKDEGRQARLLTKLGDAALDHSDHPNAQRHYDAALPLFQNTDNLPGQADCIRKLGDIAFRTHQSDKAYPHYEKALALFQLIGDGIGMAFCIQGFGEIALDRSDLALASDHFERARSLFRKSDLGVAHSVRGLGGVALGRPDLAAARSLFKEALAIYRRIGDIMGEANCLTDLGEIELRESDYATASTFFKEARPLYRRLESAPGEANCVRRLGEVSLQQKDYDTARSYLKEALEAYPKAGSGLGRPHSLMYLGDLEFAQSNRAEAARLYKEALVLYEQIPNPQYSDKIRERLSQLPK